MWKKRWLSRSGWLAAAILASIAAGIWKSFEIMLWYWFRRTGGDLPSFGGMFYYIRLFMTDGLLWRTLWNTLIAWLLALFPGLIVGWLAADAAARRPGLARFLSVAAIVLGCGFMLLQDVYYYLVVYVFYFNTFLLEHTVLAYCSIFSDILSIVVIFLVTAAMEAAALRLPEEQGGLKNLLRAASTAVAVLAAQFSLLWQGQGPTAFLLPRLIIVGIIVLLAGLFKEAKRRRERKRSAA